MSSRKIVVTYLSKDRPAIVFLPGILYAEITPHKGVLEWPDPPPIPFSQFLGYYTQEEFDQRQNKKNDDE